MTLTEFLTARLDEDEAAAGAAGGSSWVQNEGRDSDTISTGGDWAGTLLAAEEAAHVVRYDPARVLREVEAKRAMVTLHAPRAEPAPCEHFEAMPPACQECGSALDMLGYCDTFRHLAAVYSDHDDYDQAWRP